MKVTNKVTIHLDDPQVQRPVNVMQCDVHTRVLEIALFAGGKKWEIPDRITPVISYHKPDGTGGLYDTLPDGSSACRMDKNTVWAIMPPPALEVPGRVDLVVIFADDNGDQLATFGVPIDVHRNPGVGAVASGDYFNLQKWVKETAVAAVPTKLPNPQKLILTGAVVAEYDGSGEVKVEIPEGSGVHIGPDRPQNGEAIWIKTDEQDEEAAPEVHIGSEPPTNGEAIWINPDEEPESGGAVSPEAIQQAVESYMAANPVKETDPTVPDWAKQPEKPKYTAAEVGALPVDTPIPEGIPIPSSAQVGQTIVVKAVDENGKPMEWEPGNAGAKWNLVRHLVVEEAVTSISISSDEAGNPISDKKYSEMYVDYYIPGLGTGNYSSRYGSISFWFNGGWGGGKSVDFSDGGNGYDGIRSAVHAVRPPIQGVGLSIETPTFYAIMAHTGRIMYAVHEVEGLVGVNIRTAAGITAGSVFNVYAR